MTGQPAPREAGSVAYPALCVPKDSGVYVVEGPAQLQRSRAALVWSYRHFDGLRLFDSHEMAWLVTASRVSRPRSRLARAVARALDLAVTVEVQLRPIGPASLPEAVSAVRAAIESDAESFEELSERSVEWWEGALARAASVRQVIDAFEQSRRAG